MHGARCSLFLAAFVLAPLAAPTAVAPGWSDEMQRWRDCMLGVATPPWGDLCVQELLDLIEAIRAEYYPFCADPNPSAFPDDPENVVYVHECD